MKYLLAVLAAFALVAAVAASDLGSQQPFKPSIRHIAPPVAADVLRQGGDTIADATPITSIPFYDTGTTVGYVDDYDII